MTIRKTLFCTFILLFVFYLGFGLGGLKRRETDWPQDLVYVYDSEKKVADYYMEMKKVILGVGLPKESPEIKEAIEKVKRMRPLVAAGPIVVFFDNNTGEYLVCEKHWNNPLVEWVKSRKPFERLYVHSRIEKDWRWPQFECAFAYSIDGIYEKCAFFVFGKDGKPLRAYSDTKGVGIFDKMDVFENGVQKTYHLVNLSWEKVNEKSYEPSQEKYENLLLNLSPCACPRSLDDCPCPTDVFGPENAGADSQTGQK